MRTKPVKFITFNQKAEPDLILKLNAVAPYERRSVHALAKIILADYLDKYIDENSIDVEGFRQAALV